MVRFVRINTGGEFIALLTGLLQEASSVVSTTMYSGLKRVEPTHTHAIALTSTHWKLLHPLNTHHSGHNTTPTVIPLSHSYTTQHITAEEDVQGKGRGGLRQRNQLRQQLRQRQRNQRPTAPDSTTERQPRTRTGDWNQRGHRDREPRIPATLSGDHHCTPPRVRCCPPPTQQGEESATDIGATNTGTGHSRDTGTGTGHHQTDTDAAQRLHSFPTSRRSPSSPAAPSSDAHGSRHLHPWGSPPRDRRGPHGSPHPCPHPYHRSRRRPCHGRRRTRPRPRPSFLCPP